MIAMSTKAPLITLVTISYNQSRYLQQAVSSVVSQKSPRCEYIVMDGGSTDGSVEVLENFSDRIDYWVSQPDGGPAAALNSAIERSRGEWLVYINSDDMLLPGALDRFMQSIKRFPDADVIYGHGICVDHRRNRVFPILSDRWSCRAYAQGRVSIVQQATCTRLSAVRNVGGFNLANRSSWDGELLFMLGEAGARFRRVNDFQGMFRLHDESITGSARMRADVQNDLQRIRDRCGIRPAVGGRIMTRLCKLAGDPLHMVRKSRHLATNAFAPQVYRQMIQRRYGVDLSEIENLLSQEGVRE